MILLIDNYDSFVYTLAGYVERIGHTAAVYRNDAITCDDIAAVKPRGIILSPGPRAPQDAGICIEVIKRFGQSIPILGVCLGHQAIGEAYGGETIPAPAPCHGRKSDITLKHPSPIFQNCRAAITVGRYHSLAVKLPDSCDLKVTAISEDGCIMAMEHKTAPLYGIQFHPESILTPDGMLMMENFLTLAQKYTPQT